MGRVLVIGVDALSSVLVDRWVEAGHLPAFRRLREEGVWGALRSTGEFSSPQAWPSFMTGVNPGRHGIFSFLQHVPCTYDVEHVTSQNLQAPTIFRLLSNAGARVASLNLPCTYPLAPLNGVGVADWLCPSLRAPGATYPAGLAEEIRRDFGDYPFHVDIKRHARAGRYDRAVRNALAGLHVKQALAKRLYARGPWDLFVLAFVETDAIQHYFWHFSDPSDPRYARADRARWGEPVLAVYQAVDAILGEWLELMEEDTTLLVMSDHGGAIFNRGQTYMPAILEELGLLVAKHRAGAQLFRPVRRGLQSVGEALHGSLPKQLKMRLYNHPLTRRLVEQFFAQSLTANNDWSRTRAYSYYWDTAPWINLAGREPAGIVEPGAEYEAVRETIMEALRGAWDEATGEPAIERVYRREEVYAGPCLEYMPDLGIWWNRRLPLEGPLRLANGARLTRQSMDVSGITGGHDPFGAVGLRGVGVDRDLALGDARIEDLAPTILALLGQTVPTHMDGAPLEPVGGRRLTVIAEESQEASLFQPPAPVYSAGEEEIVEERLRNLGYL